MMLIVTIKQAPRPVQGRWLAPDNSIIRGSLVPSPAVLGAIIGIPGKDGSSGTVEHIQNAPSASWVITHPIGRTPAVTVYLMSGEQIETDVFADATTVNITFSTATAGRAILN